MADEVSVGRFKVARVGSGYVSVLDRLSNKEFLVTAEAFEAAVQGLVAMARVNLTTVSLS